MNGKKIVNIIGGGIAGLSAAIILAEKDFKVRVFEASNSIGGRAKSFIDNKSNDLTDNGQHIMIGAYKYFMDFILKFNKVDDFEIQKSLYSVFNTGSKTSIIDTSLLPSKLGFIYGFSKFDLLNIYEKFQIINFYLRIILNVKFNSEISALELLRKWKQNDKLIHLFWRPLIISALNTEPNIASAEVFINVMKQGFFKDNKSSGFIFARKSFSNILSNFAHPNIEIFVNHSVNKINFGNGEVDSISVRGKEFYADFNIAAIPPYALSRLVDANEFLFLSKFEYSPIVSIYLWYQNFEIEHKFSNLVGGNFDWIFNKNKIDKRKSEFGNGFFTFTKSAANEMITLSNDEILNKSIDDMKKFYNCNEIPIHYKIYKEKFATISASPKIEMLRKSIPDCISKLFLCGEWTNTGLPSTLEGAAKSGYRIANLINYD